MAREHLQLPRLPVFGWESLSGDRKSSLPSVLDSANIRFTTSGRAAIALALRALRIGAGDRVLVPTYHCPTMIAPVVAAGAEPIFFPIDSTGAPRLEAFQGRELAGTRAVIAAHYFGLPQPMAALRDFCDSRGIALIEDCAHALFGRSDGRPVGQWGDFAIASLTKFLPVMDGGVIVARSSFNKWAPPSPLAAGEEIKHFANVAENAAHYGRLTGMNALLSAAFSVVASMRKKKHLTPSATANAVQNSSRDRWLADLGPASASERDASLWTHWAVKHVRQARIVDLRRRNYLRLVSLVEGISGVRALMPSLPDASAPYVFPLFVDCPEAIYAASRASGVPVFRWDEVWPNCPTIAGDYGRTWSTHIFQIGCHQDLREADLHAIANRLRVLVDGDRR